MMAVPDSSLVLVPLRAARRSLPLAVVAAVGVVLASCGGGGAPAGGAGAGGGPGGAAPAMPVGIVTLEAKPVEQTGDFVGTLKSRRSATIQPQVEGVLTKILVRSGERVAAGTPLFEIDATSQQAAVASLESVRAARVADATYARQQADRAKALLDAGASSQQQYEQAIAQQAAADAQLKSVEEQIRQTKAELAYYSVTAGTSGTVGDVPVRVGDRVTKSTVLTTIDDNAGLEVYVTVPVQLAPRLKIGLPIRLVGETGETLATERINFISPSVDDATQGVLVKAPLSDRGGGLRADQFVRARIVWATEPGLTIPVVSVVRVNGQFFAFLAEPGQGGGLTARQHAVTLGPVIGNDYLVLSGLEAGDRLIVSGLQKIGDGAPVQAMPAGPPAGGGAGEGRGRSGGEGR
jgi:RND family efflux transporter MFP subunit